MLSLRRTPSSTSARYVLHAECAPVEQLLTIQRIAYIYKAPTEKRGTRVRVIWGRVTRTHGGNGVVRSKFRHNIPPKAFGESVRVLLYPSNSM